MKTNLNSEDIIYSLNVEDIQNVAEQELDRTLTSSEVSIVVSELEKRINWFELIAESIHAKVKSMEL